MSRERVLVAGLGNLFRGDDAFGSEVARLLMTRDLPPEVRVIDFGTRGHDFAFALADGYRSVLVVDTVCRGANPGTLFVIEPEADELEKWCGEGGRDPSHDVNPMAAIRLANLLCTELPHIVLVGCEPMDMGHESEGRVGLSNPVAAAVEPAADRVMTLVVEMCNSPQQSFSD